MEHSLRLDGAVQAAFSEAVERACGADVAASVTSNGRTPVQQASHWRKYGDFQSKVAESIYKSHIATRRREHGDYSGVMRVTTRSRFDWVTERSYSSAREVAEELVRCLPEDAMLNVISDVVLEGDCSMLRITSVPHMQWHLEHDRHPCASCGQFCQGAFGLRTHQVQAHAIEAQTVRDKYLVHTLQMITYTPPLPAIQPPSAPVEADALCCRAAQDDQKPSARPLTTLHENQQVCIEAAKIGDIDTIMALANGTYINDDTAPLNVSACYDDEGNSPLSWAAGNGYLNVCRYLVEECGMDPARAVGKKKRRRQAIHWSARNGHSHICEWLVTSHGIDVDATTENGTTPLHFAIWMGQFDCVSWLVEVGKCDVNKRNDFGCNAAHWCGFKGDVDMLKYMQRQGLDFMHINKNKRSAVHKAAVKGNFEACQWLLTPAEEGGGGLSNRHMQPELEGDTPITLAASAGYLDLRDYLSEKYEAFEAQEDINFEAQADINSNAVVSHAAVS